MQDLYFLWFGLFYSMGPSSLSWEEIGAFLKECWWLVALFLILFVPRAYLLHREHKLQMEEEEEQERLRERYGDALPEQKKEEKPSYEDTYINTPPSRRVPDGEVLFAERNKTAPRYEWRFLVLLLTLGFMIGMGGSVGGISDVLMLLMIAVLLCILIIAQHLGPNWMYTSFAEDADKKRVNWKKVGKDLLPYGAAFAIGLILGFLRLLITGR